jgi:hypothetical protein
VSYGARTPSRIDSLHYRSTDPFLVVQISVSRNNFKPSDNSSLYLVPTSPRDAGVDGRVIFKMDAKEIACKDVDWIHLAQDRDQWRAVVSTEMNVRVL